MALAIALLLTPFLLLHRHYDAVTDALQDRIEVYRRVAAQTPELKKALEALRAKDGRRFFLHNTALNLAGAELQDLVRAAIENNGGRITTIQTAQPREDGRFRQVTVKLTNPDLSVRTRRGYYAVKSEAAITEDAPVRKLSEFPAAGCTLNGAPCAIGCCESKRPPAS